MSNIEFLAKALSLHTKGKDASFLKESAVVEAKCSCCDDDPCSCPSDCKCKMDESAKDHSKEETEIEENQKRELQKKLAKVSAPSKKGKEAVTLPKAPWEKENKLQEDHFKVGDTVKPNKGPHANQPHEVIHDHGDGHYNIKPKGITASRIQYRLGAARAHHSDLVKEDLDEGALAGHYRAIRAMKDSGKSEEEAMEAAKKRGAHPNTVKDIYGTMKKEVSEELVDDFIEFMSMMEDFAELFEQGELSIDEAIEEWYSEDEYVEENFGKMSKTKRLVAAKKAALTKAKTGNWGGGRPSGPKKPKPIQPVKRIRVRRRTV